MNGRVLTPQTQRKLSRLFDAQYQAYMDAVLTGRRVCGRLERLKVQRQAEDLKKTWRWAFDYERAVKPLLWMAANLKFPLGEKRGKPLKLEPWQVFDIMTLFGWVDKYSRYRRFLQAYWQIGRKNGKSTLAGAVLDYLAFGDGVPAAYCCVAANSLEQAGECFSRAEESLKLAKHQGVESFNSRTYKRIHWGDSNIFALTAAPKDGKLAHGAILDEYHEARDSGMLDSLLTGNVSDPEALVLIITTAGTDLTGVCHQDFEMCIKILDGTASDRYMISIYAPDADDAVDSVETWQKANPNWGVSVNEDLMRARYEDSKLSASDMQIFKTKNLDMWVHSLTRWANMDKWNELCCYPFEIADGSVCYGGLDLSSVSDFSAFCLDFPPVGTEQVHRQLYHFWIPEEKVTEIARQCSIPLEQWVADGYVTATPGPVIDYEYISRHIEAMREKYEIRLIAADRWRLNELARVMPSWFTDLTIEFSQGMKSMSPTIQQFERMYLTGQINSGGNPVMRWMMSCAESFTDSNGNVKLVKPRHHKSTSRIDGVIASVMATDTAVTQEPKGLTEADLSTMISFF
jgi:phage terminase large subunit-like protein